MNPLLHVKWTDYPMLYTVLFVFAWSPCLTIYSEVRDHIHSSVYTKLMSSVVMWCFHTKRRFTLNWNFASQTFQRVSHQINNPYMENLVENQKNWCVTILLKPSNPLDKMASYFCPHTPPTPHYFPQKSRVAFRTKASNCTGDLWLFTMGEHMLSLYTDPWVR